MIESQDLADVQNFLHLKEVPRKETRELCEAPEGTDERSSKKELQGHLKARGLIDEGRRLLRVVVAPHVDQPLLL